MEMIFRILHTMVFEASPILLCVLGGLWAYKANVLNIGLEGIMLMGAFISVLSIVSGLGFVAGYLLAVISCVLLGLVFSYLGITKKGNVIVVGLAINMVVPAIAGFLLQEKETANLIIKNFNSSVFKLNLPLIKDIPVIGDILSGHTPLTYVSFILIIVMSLIMYKTKFGIYVRVVGENEDAARSLGLKVGKYKYLAIIIGAICCALAGINLSVESLGLFTNNMTAGRGFIAIAAIYCGSASPIRSGLYALLFGLSRSLSVNLSLFAGDLAALFDIIPYVIMTMVLAIVSIINMRNSRERSF